MQIKKQIIPYQLLYPITDTYVKEKVVFFDIETTGFSSEMSYVYLIGCCYYKENTYQLIQWFSDGIDQEEELLMHFGEFIQSYRLLVHYNGTGFDLPYLKQKFKFHQLSYNFEHIDSFDIYKQIIPYKKRLPITDLKLKTIERFLHIQRRDPYDGGQLIQIYLKYLAFHTLELKKVETSTLHPSKQSGLPTLGDGHAKDYLDILLLHNAEDITNLLMISPILSYVDLFQGNVIVTNATLSEAGLILQLDLPFSLPVPIKDLLELSCFNGMFHLLLKASQTTATLLIPVFTGEMKFFLEHYKDYYYLPYEDTAIHKSVGEYVEKAYRQNAKATNCYIKKTSKFLPQRSNFKAPAFRFDLKDKLTWFEIEDSFLSDTIQLTQYVKNLYHNLG